MLILFKRDRDQKQVVKTCFFLIMLQPAMIILANIIKRSKGLIPLHHKTPTLKVKISQLIIGFMIKRTVKPKTIIF